MNSIAMAPPLIAPAKEPLAENIFRAELNPPCGVVNYWPIGLMGTIISVRNVHCPFPNDPEFIFKLDGEAAEENMCVLNKYDKNPEKAIGAQSDSPVGYGSEFKSVGALKSLFDFHPN